MTDRERAHHPALADLLAYRAAECAESTADEVREHLAGCKDCARLLLDANGGADPDDPVLLRAWEEQRRRLRAAGQLPESAAGAHRRVRFGFRLAAMIAVGMLATLALYSTFGLRRARTEVAELQGRLAQLERPRNAVALVNLHTEGSFRSELPFGGASIAAPRAGDLVVLRLFLAEMPLQQTLKLEVVGPGERDRTVVAGLVPQDPGVVIVGLLGDRLPPGTYSIELKAPNDVILARYEMTVDEETG